MTTASVPQTPSLITANGLTNREAALFYASLGWAVLPLWWIEFDDQLDRYVCACGRSECEERGSQGKHPWNASGLRAATSFAPMIERWWGTEPRLGVGVAQKQSGLVTLDRDGWKDAVKASEWGFDLRDAAIQESGSGNGEHYVWRTSQIGDAVPSSGINAVDTKYDGHVVVAPTLHKSGRKYAWQTSQLPGPIPQALLTRLLEPKVTRSTPSSSLADDKVDRDAIMRGDWSLGGAGYDTHRNALIGLIRSHWAQGKLSLDEIKDFAWLAAQRGNTATDREKYWKYAEVVRLVEDTCAKKQPGLSEGYQLDVATPEEQAVARKLVGLDEDAARANLEAFDKRLNDQVARLLVERAARALVEDREATEARGERVKRTAAQYELVEQPEVVLEGLLAADVNLLAGPAQQGKSLWARDLAFEVARRGRNVLMITSESNHDFATRYTTQPGYADVSDSLYILDQPIRVTAESEVQWLLDEYADERPGLVVFDLITDMGVEKEEKGDDVGRVIRALKRISREWGAATLAIGHPPLNGERRFRGSSAWRDRCLVEWHMAGGYLSCEKTKIGPKPANRYYRATYPGITWSDGSPSLTVAFEGAIREQRDQEARIVELVRRLEHASKNGIYKMLGGNKANLLADIDLLIAAGKLIEERPGRLVAAPE